MRPHATRLTTVLLCGAFVLGALDNDAHAARKRRRSRAVKKAEKARKKAEEERKKAEQERLAAERERQAAERAAADAKQQADEAKRQLEAMKAASAAAKPAVASQPATAATQIAPAKPLWSGFFLSFNVGYSTAGGESGPSIPDPSNGYKTNLTPGLMRGANFASYQKAVTTDVGAGLAVDFQIGYNIAGYVSLWADVAANGSFGAKSDLAGAGTVALMLGFHPLRLWRPDAPADIKLYGGYGIFEVLGYHEVVFQPEATGKAWTGTSIPFGLSAEYRIPDSVFAMGLDLRFIRGSYDRWIYNYDEDMKSDLGSAEHPVTTTFRFAPRVIFGWHF